MRRRSLVAVLVTCVVGMTSYWGIVTELAFVLYLPLAVVLPGLVAMPSALRGRVGPSVLAGLLTAFAWAVLTNVLSGISNGPVARSTLAAGASTVLAVAAAGSAAPSLFAVPVAGMVLGALVLSGYAVGPPGIGHGAAMCTAVAAVVALALLDQDRGRWVSRRPGRWAVPFIALLAGGGAALAMYLQGFEWPEPPPAVDAAGADLPIWMWIAFALLTLLFVAGVAVGIRLLVVQARWRRLRRRLSQGTDVERVAGAWLWAKARLAACELPVASHVPPDLVALGSGLDGFPVKLAGVLRQLAAAAEVVAFSRHGTVVPDAAESAWTLADDVAERGYVRLSATSRLRSMLRPPTDAREAPGR